MSPTSEAPSQSTLQESELNTNKEPKQEPLTNQDSADTAQAGLNEKTEKDPESQAPAAQPPPAASGLAAPDGGLEAWLVALGCFCAFFASFGFV